MKIQDLQKNPQLDTYLKQIQSAQNVQETPPAQGQPVAGTSNDRVELSTHSRFLQRVNQAMETIDPERAAKVNQIKDQVAQGTYNVEPAKVAQAMARDLLKDLG